MGLIIDLLVWTLEIYLWILILTVTVSWLVAFDVLNTRHKMVAKFCKFLNAVTNPVILPLRKFIPPLGGMDLSPMAVMIGIYVGVDVLLRLKQYLIFHP